MMEQETNHVMVVKKLTTSLLEVVQKKMNQPNNQAGLSLIVPKVVKEITELSVPEIDKSVTGVFQVMP